MTLEARPRGHCGGATPRDGSRDGPISHLDAEKKKTALRRQAEFKRAVLLGQPRTLPIQKEKEVHRERVERVQISALDQTQLAVP
jgi:hypothetical protein